MVVSALACLLFHNIQNSCIIISNGNLSLPYNHFLLQQTRSFLVLLVLDMQIILKDRNDSAFCLARPETEIANILLSYNINSIVCL